VAELGGGQVKAKTEIPEHGWYGHFTDPDVNTMDLFAGKSIE